MDDMYSYSGLIMRDANGLGARASLSPNAPVFKNAPMSNVKLKINLAKANTISVRAACRFNNLLLHVRMSGWRLSCC